MHVLETPQSQALWAVPWEVQTAMGFEKGWNSFHPAWFSCMRTFHTLRVWVYLCLLAPLDHLLDPQKLPTLLSGILSVPFLLSTAQSPILLWVLGLSLLPGRAWVSSPQYLHWVSSHDSSQELFSSGLYLLSMASCPRRHPNSLALSYLGAKGMDYFMDKTAFELGLGGCTEFC